VVWGHSGGARINPLVDGARMFQEMLRVRWYDLSGEYDSTGERDSSTENPTEHQSHTEDT